MQSNPPTNGAENGTEKRRYSAGDFIAGKYRLVRVLGEGGMGEVWEALNVGLDAPVAVKLIRGELEEESARERLIQEARAAAKLGHPAIVRMFDVGETEFGDPFIVMELLRGESLSAVLERQHRIPSVAAVQMLLPIVDALSSAHAKRLVHRDLKPENVFLAEDGEGSVQPKLVDFGVVKIEQGGVTSKLTQIGTVVGSPAYMAPEQARGRDDIDFRADIWAFCVLMYEAVSGKLPFQGANYNALLRAIVEEDPQPITELAAGDPELWTIIKIGLRKDREDRWQSMFELGRMLANWLLDQGVEQDVCGTWISAKWLSAPNSPRPRDVLQSLSFEDAEPSGVFGGNVMSMRRPVSSGRRTPNSPTGHGMSTESSVSGATISSGSAHPAVAMHRPKRVHWALGGVGLLALGGLVWLLVSGQGATAAGPSPAANPGAPTKAERGKDDAVAKQSEAAKTKASKPVPPVLDLDDEAVAEASTSATRAVPRGEAAGKPAAEQTSVATPAGDGSEKTGSSVGGEDYTEDATSKAVAAEKAAPRPTSNRPARARRKPKKPAADLDLKSPY